MKESSSFLLAPKVQEYLGQLGLVDRVPELIQKAAIVSHPKGNRRYHNLVFDVKGNTINDVVDIRSTDERGRVETFAVIEECPCVESGDLGKRLMCGICKGSGQIKIVRQVRK